MNFLSTLALLSKDPKASCALPPESLHRPAYICRGPSLGWTRYAEIMYPRGITMSGDGDGDGDGRDGGRGDL